MRKPLKCSVLVYLSLMINAGSGFNIIGINKQMLYEYEGSVAVGAKAPQDDEHPAPPASGWIVRGKLTLQRQNKETLAAALSIDDVRLNNSGEKFLQNKEMYPPYKPFKIALTADGTISHLLFKDSDPIWSMNFKRAIASTLQFQIKSVGAFVIDEIGIHGKCSTEYFVSNKTNYISIRKTPELKTCTPYAEAVHITRSNVPPNLCEFDFQKSVIIGNEAVYGLMPHADTEYFLSMAHVKGSTLVHTFESTGEAQYINSQLLLNFLNETTIDNAFDIETAMAPNKSGLELEPLDSNDPTGGRHPQLQEALVTTASEMLNSLAEGLENSDLKFAEPYDSTVAELIKVLSQIDYESLQKLYTEVDIGTSYRQETIRNIFYEIIPRIGTKASVFLTRDLVMEKQIKSTTAVQLLISLPFHIFELSKDLVKKCEVFLTLGPDRPDVKQAAILSFATLVHNVFVAGQLSKDAFEDYVQKYFNLFLNGHDYENKMLYLQGLSNLQLGNVANYLDPIVNNDGENDDIKFLASWATMPLATTRPDKIYELYWPIFESKNATLEMRVAAVTLLLISNPTPARLISIHRIIQSETCPHLINYYRTTITSISETTYPCYQHLRRLLSYMHRHLPQKPEPRYWVTGNYIFDYREPKYGIGAMLQAFMIGDPKSDLPVVGYFKFDTEALGKFTGQLSLYVKARGLPDAILGRILNTDVNNVKFDDLKTILDLMNAPRIRNNPLHLELILQMEGKTVLSYYLNEKTYANFSYSDLINRFNLLISSDSHINMQTIRWPFMTKYAVPTVIGTAADVLLQTTVLTSLRGNITQHNSNDTIKRTHQIDARYSSYASCRSRSYNPFLNLDHEINREQGFLIYIPFNNEVFGNMSCFKYSFSRPENLISGLSFKSRSMTSTRGFITKSSSQPFEELILPEKTQGAFQLFRYDSEDLGVSFSINTNRDEINKFRTMMLKSGFIENLLSFSGFSKNMMINLLLYVFGLAQLSSIHLGYDRNFTLLVTNGDSTKIEGSFCNTDIVNGNDNIGNHIDFTISHTNDVSTEELHKWTTQMDFKQSTNAQWYNMVGTIERATNKEDKLWKACLNFTYSPLVFIKRRHTLQGEVVFGKSQTSCPDNQSIVKLIATAGPSEDAYKSFLSGNELVDNEYCPKEVLKFSPIPTSKYCKRINFEHFTSITRYGIDLKSKNMPDWFEFVSHRLGHLFSAISDEKVDHLDMDKDIQLSINTTNDEPWLSIVVNNVGGHIYHPLLTKLISKYDAIEQFSYDTGLKRSCSIISGMINTFDDNLLNLNDYFRRNESCLTLLAADCSYQPRMAIFLVPPVTENDTNFGLKIQFGKNFLTFEPQNITNDDPVFISINNQFKIDIRSKAYTFPADKKEDFEFRVGLTEQNIMNVEHNPMKSTIQFDMNNLFNLEIYGVFKNRICGLCSKPQNRMKDYTLCA